MEYSLQLVEEKVKQHQVTALHLTSALAFVGAGAIMYAYNEAIKYYGLALLLAGLALLAITIGKNRMVTSPSFNWIFRLVELAIAMGICGYSALQRWNLPIGIYGVLSAGIAFAMYWERQAGGAQYINISEDGIKLPIASRTRFVEWTEVNAVILRFGTLTVDCLDNRLFQWNVQPADLDATIFERYCREQVLANKSKREVDWWPAKNDTAS